MSLRISGLRLLDRFGLVGRKRGNSVFFRERGKDDQAFTSDRG